MKISLIFDIIAEGHNLTYKNDIWLFDSVAMSGLKYESDDPEDIKNPVKFFNKCVILSFNVASELVSMKEYQKTKYKEYRLQVVPHSPRYMPSCQCV